MQNDVQIFLYSTFTVSQKMSFFIYLAVTENSGEKILFIIVLKATYLSYQFSDTYKFYVPYVLYSMLLPYIKYYFTPTFQSQKILGTEYSLSLHLNTYIYHIDLVVALKIMYKCVVQYIYFQT